MLSEARREQILTIAQSPVRIPSLAGEEGAVIEQTAHWMRELGCDDVQMDACGNLIGTLRGGQGATVIYDSHVDTVAASDLSARRRDPFGGVVADGKLCGREACDVKGSLSAALAAADPTFCAEASIDIGAFTCYAGMPLRGKKFQAARQNDSAHPMEQAAEIGRYNFCANGSHAASVGLLAIGYGAGSERAARITDEYLALDQPFGAAEGYCALGASFAT